VTEKSAAVAKVVDSAVDDAVVESLLEASRALVAVSARSIAFAPSGITFPQYRMLVVLNDGSVNLTVLARHLDVAPSTALRMVDRLVAGELVDRVVPPENRRETLLSLTAAGKRTVRTVTARRKRDLGRILARLSPATQRDLAEAMAAFAAAAEEYWEE
jgi:DNA-binding MarR family transcriptional regulator